jgi:predicted dehydrogenase
MPETRKTRFGVIGCGGAAVPVCAAIAASPLIELAAVHDLDLGLARDLGERYGAYVAAMLEDLLNDSAIEAVYIAVPHHALAPLARRALKAGKHALVEKPMATTIAEADDLIALAETRRVALGVFYELRYHHAYQHARELIQTGAIGKVIGVRIQTLIDKPSAYWSVGLTGRSASPWRAIKAQSGGGVVLMNSSHALDAFRYLSGLEVVGVSAEIGTLVAEVEVEDTAAAVLRFDNGAIGSLFAGAHLAGACTGDERFDIYGTHGQLRLPDAYSNNGLQVYLRRDWAGLTAASWHTLPTDTTDVYARAVEGFARAVQRGEPAPISGQDARQVLATILAIYQAAAEQRTVTISQRELTHDRN